MICLAFYMFSFFPLLHFVRVFYSPYTSHVRQTFLNSYKINLSDFVLLASDGDSFHFLLPSGAENRVNYIPQFKEHCLPQTMKNLSYIFPIICFLHERRSYTPLLFPTGMHFNIL